MSFAARYPGTCRNCGAAIVPGQQVFPLPRANGTKSYAHARCNRARVKRGRKTSAAQLAFPFTLDTVK